MTVPLYAFSAPADRTGSALPAIHSQVLRLFAMVTEGLAAATAAFLSGDREAARRLVAEDRLIDELQCSTEELVHTELSRPERSDDDLRLFVSVLRVVPELERSGDLVEHIALRTQLGLVGQLTPLTRGLIGEMGRIGVRMWQEAADAWARRDATATHQLRLLDDELDDLHVRLTAEVAQSTTSIPVAIELGLLARFFERLGDHAVNVTGRIGYLVSDPAGSS
ncbi:MAG: phosphate signaling complex PhoU family protein [Acidimicrobiales bacterium]